MFAIEVKKDDRCWAEYVFFCTNGNYFGAGPKHFFKDSSLSTKIAGFSTVKDAQYVIDTELRDRLWETKIITMPASEFFSAS